MKSKFSSMTLFEKQALSINQDLECFTENYDKHTPTDENHSSDPAQSSALDNLILDRIKKGLPFAIANTIIISAHMQIHLESPAEAARLNQLAQNLVGTYRQFFSTSENTAILKRFPEYFSDFVRVNSQKRGAARSLSTSTEISHSTQEAQSKEGVPSSSSSSSSSTQWIPPTDPLLRGVFMPKTIVEALKSLTQEGYLAVVGGSQARKAIHNHYFSEFKIDEPDDFDIFTNCPPSILQKKFPSFVNNINDYALFRGTLKCENDLAISVDLTYINASSLPDIMSKLDLTVNTFLIDEDLNLHGNERACADLRAKQLNTVIPIDESLKLDPVRIFRHIRAADQLKWPLSSIAVEGIRRNAHYLTSRLTFGRYLAHIKKMLCNSPNKVHAHLSHFVNLGIVSYLFSSESINESKYSEMYSNYIYAFWNYELGQIQSTKIDPGMVIALLGLPFIINHPMLHLQAIDTIINNFINDYRNSFNSGTIEDNAKFDLTSHSIKTWLNLYYNRYTLFKSQQIDFQIGHMYSLCTQLQSNLTHQQWTIEQLCYQVQALSLHSPVQPPPIIHSNLEHHAPEKTSDVSIQESSVSKNIHFKI